MAEPAPTSPQVAPPSIWWFAFGYFACYAPYSAAAKALSEGLVPGQETPVSGFEMLPLSVAASSLGMLAFLGAMGWFRTARQLRLGPLSLPIPGPWTFLSGLCTAAIVATTTLSYTFEGASIVFMMLLMRGGVLAIAPVIDLLSRRKVRWYSVVALALSVSALLVAFAEEGGTALTLLAAVDVAVYLASYFVRLRFMSHLAKSEDPRASTRYFTEEQIVATPMVLAFLGAVALFGGEGAMASEVRQGFTGILEHPALVVATTVVLGLCSQGTGIFGGLILLDRRENAFCVPVNRSSSVLAGLVASFALWAGLGLAPPSRGQLLGAGLILLAILFLSIPPFLQAREAAQGRARG